MNHLFWDLAVRLDRPLLRSVLFPGVAMSDEEAYERVLRESSVAGGADLRRLVPFLQPTALALGLAGPDRILNRVEVLTARDRGEAGLVRDFWARVEAFEGTCVSFDGRDLGLPVLELRALHHACPAPRHFARSDGAGEAAVRHLDLSSCFPALATLPHRAATDLVDRLTEPGRSGSTGVAPSPRGDADEGGAACRRGLVRTYMVFLRLELLRGRITAAALDPLEHAAWRFLSEAAQG